MDPFVTLVDELFGEAVDPRELSDLISKLNDASEMHVATGLAARKKRERTEARVGLASNIVGITAGTAALASAAKDDRFREGGKAAKAIYRLGRKLPSITPKTGRAGAIMAGGAAALQAGNLIGDVVANRVLNRAAKDEVEKAFDQILDARRQGRIDTATAERMADRVLAKAQENSDAKAIFDAVDAIAPAIPSQKVQVANKTLQGSRKLAMKAKKAPTQPIRPEQPQHDVTWSGTVSKRNDEKRQVFGFCTVTAINGEPVVDLQDDYIPLEEIEKSAYTYVVESRKGGDMHSRVGRTLDSPNGVPLHTSDMIESFVITPEKLEKMGLAPNALPHGWWVGFQVNDEEQWNLVKRNERTGFSIHGKGIRQEKVIA